MATSDYNSSIDLRLPLVPDTQPFDSPTIFRDIDALFNAVRLLAAETSALQESAIPDAPSDGEIYGRQDGNWTVISGTGGGGGNFEFLGEVLLTAPSTTLTFDELDSDEDRIYKLELAGVSGGAAASDVALYYNGDTTPSNYQSQYFYAYLGSLAGGRTSTAIIAGGFISGANTPVVASITIYKTPGITPVAMSLTSGMDGGDLLLLNRAVKWANTAKITSMTLQHTGSTFAAGTIARLYRLTSP